MRATAWSGARLGEPQRVRWGERARTAPLPDASLPSGGPGRTYNGNFALREFRVTARPAGEDARVLGATLRNPQASFSQITYGGWPVTAAVDGNSKSAWSIDPQEGFSHVAVFETSERVGFRGGTVLEFTLEQGYLDRSPDHAIGRRRLSVTTTRPPIPLAAGASSASQAFELSAASALSADLELTTSAYFIPNSP